MGVVEGPLESSYCIAFDKDGISLSLEEGGRKEKPHHEVRAVEEVNVG